MLQKAICLLVTLSLVSCGTGKQKRTYRKIRTITVEESSKETAPILVVSIREETKNLKARKIIATAMTFSGTKYKYGGTTRKGMDCSGLVFVSLKENDIVFPRISYQMAEMGKRIKVAEIRKGDLLFFKTGKIGKRINHVGLVVKVQGDNIKFIHSTSSRGVIVSSLREGYWNRSFVKATRIL